MELSICTDSLYAKLSTEQALVEVSKNGFKRVEFWSWWDKDIEKINQMRQELKLDITAICTKFISLTDPEQRGAYLNGLAETIEVAKQLNCPCIISQVGNDTLASEANQVKSIIAGLNQAADMLAGSKLTLVIEPLNTKIDHQGYFLWSSELAGSIIDAVASPNVKLLYDFYHQHIMGEQLIAQSSALLSKIGHVHFAGYPGRNELEIGEIDYQEIIQQLTNLNYQGHLGLEYFPTKEPKTSLVKWQTFMQTLKDKSV